MSPANGLITHPSPYTVPETLDRLEAILRAKAITIFARIDHSGKAAKVGLTMPPTQLLIFGNPRGGTPIMLAAPLSPQSISLSRPSPGRRTRQSVAQFQRPSLPAKPLQPQRRSPPTDYWPRSTYPTGHCLTLGSVKAAPKMEHPIAMPRSDVGYPLRVSCLARCSSLPVAAEPLSA